MPLTILIKKIRRNYLFLAILTIGIFVRLNNFDYPLVSEETNRDFIVARHIAKYHEMPMTGPNNGTLPLVGNSPSYNYFLSLLLFVRDDLMFLVFANILLQISTIILLYVAIKNIFGMSTSLTTMIFFCFANIFTNASVWPWQPYTMFVFLIWSIYLLFQFYIQKRFKFVLWSEILFALSISLHMSAIALLPAYLLTTIFLLKSQNRKTSSYLLFLTVFCFAILALYLSTIWHNSRLFDSRFVWPFNFFLNVNSLMVSLGQKLDLLFGALAVKKLLLYFLTACIPIYLFWQNVRSQKNVFLVLLFWFVSFLVIFSFLEGRFFDQHLYPAIPVLVVLMSEVFNKLLSTNRTARFFKVLVLVSLTLFLIKGSLGQINIFKFEKLKAVNNITVELSEEVLAVANSEKYTDLNFFKFKIYAPPENYWFEGNIAIADAVYWLNLEKKLSYKFVEVMDVGSESSFVPLGDDRYIFVACLYYKSEVDERNHCLRKFAVDYPQFSIIKKVGRSNYGQSFYVSKKNLTNI